MSAWIISPMTPDDIDAVMAIERQLFPRPWLRISYEKELFCDSGRMLVVRPRHYDKKSSSVIAYAGYRLILEEMHLLKIGVAPQWQRLGIASWLLRNCFTMAAADNAETAILEVRASNHPAISLYRRLGFMLIGTRPNYYSETNEDALMMKKSLKEGHYER